MQSVKQILTKARELIAEQTHWTRNTFARDHYGTEVGPTDSRATCWCSIGAIAKASDGAFESHAARVHLQKAMGGVKVDVFNDRMTHPSVLEAFDRAILSCDTSPAPL